MFVLSPGQRGDSRGQEGETPAETLKRSCEGRALCEAVGAQQVLNKCPSPSLAASPEKAARRREARRGERRRKAWEAGNDRHQVSEGAAHSRRCRRACFLPQERAGRAERRGRSWGREGAGEKGGKEEEESVQVRRGARRRHPHVHPVFLGGEREKRGRRKVG